MFSADFVKCGKWMNASRLDSGICVMGNQVSSFDN